MFTNGQTMMTILCFHIQGQLSSRSGGALAQQASEGSYFNYTSCRGGSRKEEWGGRKRLIPTMPWPPPLQKGLAHIPINTLIELDAVGSHVTEEVLGGGS